MSVRPNPLHLRTGSLLGAILRPSPASRRLAPTAAVVAGRAWLTRTRRPRPAAPDPKPSARESGPPRLPRNNEIWYRTVMLKDPDTGTQQVAEVAEIMRKIDLRAHDLQMVQDAVPSVYNALRTSKAGATDTGAPGKIPWQVVEPAVAARLARGSATRMAVCQVVPKRKEEAAEKPARDGGRAGADGPRPKQVQIRWPSSPHDTDRQLQHALAFVRRGHRVILALGWRRGRQPPRGTPKDDAVWMPGNQKLQAYVLDFWKQNPDVVLKGPDGTLLWDPSWTLSLKAEPAKPKPAREKKPPVSVTPPEEASAADGEGTEE